MTLDQDFGLGVIVPPGGGGAVGVTNPGRRVPVPGDGTTGPPSAPMGDGEGDAAGLADGLADEADSDGGVTDSSAELDEQADTVSRATAAVARPITRGDTGGLSEVGRGEVIST